MKILALVIAIYAPLMLIIHVSTARILQAWSERPDAWISRWFPSRRALRVEGVFWVAALAAWFLWRSWAWRILVVVFAAIHLGIWGAAELRRLRGGGAYKPDPKLRRAIIAFDLVEALVLVGLEVGALSYLLGGAARWF